MIPTWCPRLGGLCNTITRIFIGDHWKVVQLFWICAEADFQSWFRFYLLDHRSTDERVNQEFAIIIMIETRSLYFSDNSLTYHKTKHAFCFQLSWNTWPGSLSTTTWRYQPSVPSCLCDIIVKASKWMKTMKALSCDIAAVLTAGFLRKVFSSSVLKTPFG